MCCCLLEPLFMYCWFSLVYVLSFGCFGKVSVLAKWLARKTPLRKPNRGEGSSPKSPGRRVRMIFLVYSIVSLFDCMAVLFPCRTDIHCTSMAGYSLFVLKVLLNNNKPNRTQQWERMNVEHELKLNLAEMSMMRWMCAGVKLNERKKGARIIKLKPYVFFFCI